LASSAHGLDARDEGRSACTTSLAGAAPAAARVALEYARRDGAFERPFARRAHGPSPEIGWSHSLAITAGRDGVTCSGATGRADRFVLVHRTVWRATYAATLARGTRTRRRSRTTSSSPRAMRLRNVFFETRSTPAASSSVSSSRRAPAR